MSPTSQIQWVRQEHKSGCAIAALAMVTGRTYQYVHDYLSTRVGRFVDSKWVMGVDAEEHGIGIMFDGWSFLRDHGYAIQHRWRAPYTIAYDAPLHEPWPCEPWADVHIATVLTSACHAVVLLRNGTVLDPLTPETRRLSDYSKVEAITAVYKVASDLDINPILKVPATTTKEQ